MSQVGVSRCEWGPGIHAPNKFPRRLRSRWFLDPTVRYSSRHQRICSGLRVQAKEQIGESRTPIRVVLRKLLPPSDGQSSKADTPGVGKSEPRADWEPRERLCLLLHPIAICWLYVAIAGQMVTFPVQPLHQMSNGYIGGGASVRLQGSVQSLNNATCGREKRMQGERSVWMRVGGEK